VEDVANGAEGFGFNRIDERPHARVEGLCSCDALGSALAAFGRVLGGAAFGRIDDCARKQSVAGGGETRRLREALECRD
jgi:hypothetical protein